ncbi:MAG TPA: hypothetical protein ENN64_00855 [bacterium]|nr:hypothetical protein [bacterium]
MKEILKIKIYGEGGEGIKRASKLLGKILLKNGYKFVSIKSTYDTVVRGGSSNADIVASNRRNPPPVIESADLAVITYPTEEIVESRKYIFEESIYKRVEKPDEYKEAKVYSLSSDPKYLTGSNVIGVVMGILEIDKRVLDEMRIDEASLSKILEGLSHV